jgi:photosynthetic reaction center cytochrome c subunit
MRIHPLIRAVCAAALPLAAALVTLSAGGNTLPLPAPGQAAAGPQAQTAEKPPAAPAEKTAAEAFKNVQILKDIPASQFMPNMYFIAASLGVGCDHCHVTSDNGPWPLEKDDKKEKQTAREMMKMTQAINDQNFAGRQEVTCATCHQGHAEPVAVSPIVPLGAKNAAQEQAGDKQLPTADQILDHYVETIGGTTALEKLKTRVVKGALVTESGRTYTLEITQKAPDLGLVTATSPKGNVSRDGFDGTTAWNSAGSSVFPSSGVEGARIARDAQFFEAADVKKRFPRRFVAGKETVGGEETYLVRVGGHGNVSEMLYFSVNSGLLLRRVVLTQTTLGRFSERTDFSDYREVDGVKLPFTVARMEVNTRYTEKYSEVKHNVPVDEAVFRFPAGAK